MILLETIFQFTIPNVLLGFSDEILDIAILGPNDSHFAVATNSKDLKLYDNATMSCQLLTGHEDIVLALSTCPVDKNLLLSSGKDNSVRLWRLDESQMTCLGVGKRHTGSIAALQFLQTTPAQFVSASNDSCLKLWQIPENIVKNVTNNKKLATSDFPIALNCSKTAIAHDKDINSVCVSPNDKIIASASQDKTVKLWTSDGLELIGVLKGHRRGVWSVR